MNGSICWELNLQETDLAVRSVEVDLHTHSFDKSRWFVVDDNGIIYDVSLDSTWKSDAMRGSKAITLTAQTFSMAELMRAKLRDSNDGNKLRMVVKLQGELII